MRTIEVDLVASPAAMLWPLLRARAAAQAPILALPELTYVRPRVLLSRGHIDAYARVCGFAAAQGVPLTYPQLLAFPLLMMFLASPDCPWPALGTVHLANRIRQHAPLRPGDALRVELATGHLNAHPKGQLFALETRILRDGDLVWESSQCLLRRDVKAPCGPAFASSLSTHPPLSVQAELDAGAGIGRRYARVSGDYNPIHLAALTARLFGFRRAIAHGMWTKARALATLLPQAELGRATATVEFRSPWLLPARALLWSTGRRHFEVRNSAGSHLHLAGQLEYDMA
ncbi:MAG: MaoC/PaaZ C-terminal domain-containing protein [Pseudomonadota bacterium]